MAAATTRQVSIDVGMESIQGDLTIPELVRGVVVFAHGAGGSRFSPRNQVVARQLQAGGHVTLLLDLLTPSEEAAERVTRHLRFDVGLLAERLVAASRWLATSPGLDHLPLGYFGASTGAAAALVAAAHEPDRVGAVVARAGRPDLAGPYLPAVRAPTLLIVGARDDDTLRLNRRALVELGAPSRIEVIPGAGHRFEEPGKLQEVATLARRWFTAHLRRPLTVEVVQPR
jgi:dienelactone hydrolase